MFFILVNINLKRFIFISKLCSQEVQVERRLGKAEKERERDTLKGTQNPKKIPSELKHNFVSKENYET
jgi:hypothetical protein